MQRFTLGHDGHGRPPISGGACVPAAAADPATPGAPAVFAVSAERAEVSARYVAKVFSIEQLRQAVRQANRIPGKDRIKLGNNLTFEKGSPISETDGPRFGDLDVTDDLVVEGRGYRIDARGQDRIFDVSPDVRLVLERVGLRNGARPRGPAVVRCGTPAAPWSSAGPRRSTARSRARAPRVGRSSTTAAAWSS